MCRSVLFFVPPRLFTGKGWCNMGKDEKFEDPRDMAEPDCGEPDPIVATHIQEAIERLQEHMEVPTLGAYRRFLLAELEWIDHEKEVRHELTKPLP